MLTWISNSWSEEFSNIHFVKVDVDVATDVARDYAIQAMPTFMVFKDGQKVDGMVGANVPKLQRMIEEYNP